MLLISLETFQLVTGGRRVRREVQGRDKRLLGDKGVADEEDRPRERQDPGNGVREG